MKNFFIFLFVSFLIPVLSLAQETPKNSSDFLYLKSQALFNQGKEDDSLGSLELFFEKYASKASPLTRAMAHNLKGLIFSLQDNFISAFQEFKRSEELVREALGNDHPYVYLIRYNVAQLSFKTDNFKETLSLLLSIRPDVLGRGISIRYHNLLGRVYEKQGKLSDAIAAFLMAANRLEGVNSSALNILVRKAYRLSKIVFESNVEAIISELDEYRVRMREDGAGTWALLLILSKAYSYVGHYENAREFLEKFLRENKTHPLRKEAITILSRFESLDIVDTKKIGVLLPLSGKFSYYGELSLKAIMLGVELFNEEKKATNDQNVSFVVRDSGGNMETAIEAFEKLIIEDKVVSVIGPLLSRYSDTISYRAREYGVPLLNLSQKSNPNLAGSYVFPIALSPQQQVRAILDYAMDEKGFLRFAILAPNNSIGDKYVRIFWDMVEEKSGSIVGVERYTPGSTDFRYPIKKLLGLYYTDARTIEKSVLEERKTEYEESLKETGNLKRRLLRRFALKPVVHFDALFVPDVSSVIGQIAPSFAVHSVKDIPFLGINAWNTLDTVRRAGPFLQRSFFVDIFHQNLKEKKSLWFMETFQKYFHQSPSTLEVQAYDASRILLSALQEQPIESRSDLRSYLLYRGDYEGISGKITFTEQGVHRRAYLLGVRKNEIVEIPRLTAAQ